MDTYPINGISAVDVDPSGPLLSSEQDALDLIGETYGTGAELIVIPLERLDPEFFTLSNGRAGAFIQKLVNYQKRVAFLGDLSAKVTASKPLHDFVYESNKGRHVLFAADRDELQRLLG